MTTRSAVQALLYGRFPQRFIALGVLFLVLGLVAGLVDYLIIGRFLWGIAAAGGIALVVGLLAEWFTHRRNTER